MTFPYEKKQLGRINYLIFNQATICFTIEVYGVNMEHYAVVVVTYYPSLENIYNISNLKHSCDLLVIIDNTDADWMPMPKPSDNLLIIRNRSNIGLAAALNKGIAIAGQSGINNLFLLDQDTILPDNYFKTMANFRLENEHNGNNKVLIVPNFIDRNSGTIAKFPILMPFKISFVNAQNIATIQKKQSLIAITSGTHLTYKTFQSIGCFKNDYFIDFIDHEYCLRAATKGYKVIPNDHVVISHAIGKRTIHAFLGLTIKPTHHSAERKYYFVRNSIRTALRYFPQFPAYTLLVFAHIIHELLSSILYEQHSITKVKAMGYGMIHGIMNKMGACKIEFK